MNVIIISFMLMLGCISVHSISMTKLEEKLLNMVVECTTFNNQPDVGQKRPAFTATLGGQPTLSGTNAIVKFDNVYLNRDGGYDPKTGIFTAPRTGLYQISVTIMSANGKDLSLHIVKNKQVLLYLYGSHLHGSTETANPVLELKSGDKVFVRNGSSGSQVIVGSHFSYFSGYYISE